MPLELDVMTYRSMYEARYSKIATGIMCQSTFLHILSISCGSYCERTLLVATPCPSVLLSLSEPVDDSEVEARFKSDILTTVGLQAGGWYKHKRRGDRVAPSYISPDSRKKNLGTKCHYQEVQSSWERAWGWRNASRGFCEMLSFSFMRSWSNASLSGK